MRGWWVWMVAAMLALGCEDDSGEDASDTATDTRVEDTAQDSGPEDSAEEVDTAEPPPEPEPLPFQEGFFWGTAIAGFQVDMGCPTVAPEVCEDRNADWYAFITDEATLNSDRTFLAGDPPSAGPGHWELYASDYDAAQSMGTNALRMSIEWSRIFPTATDDVEGYEALKAIADADAIQTYHDMFQALRARGIEPMVTLNHYTLPTWIHDGVGCHLDIEGCSPRGWVDRERTVREIAKYAGFVAEEFGAEVDYWFTLNEPFAVVLPGYIAPTVDRTNPPANGSSAEAARTVIVAMIEGHARMYDALKAADTVDANSDATAAEVGLVFNVTPVVPKDPEKAVDVEAAENIFYLFNEVFLNATVKGMLDHDLDGTAEPREDLMDRMDFLGINYYTRIRIEGFPASVFPDLTPLATFNPLSLGDVFADDPEGIYVAVRYVTEELGVPWVMISENGAPITDDKDMDSFLVRHLTWLARAARDGSDIRGYFYWSLVDNYEWNHGMDLRFGLLGVDETDPDKPRTLRSHAQTFSAIIEANGVPEFMQERYPAP